MHGQVFTGERLWYVDSWNIPTAIEVDFHDLATDRIVGRNSRGATVAMPLRDTYRTLEKLEKRILKGVL